MTARQAAVLAVVTLIWGGSFLFMKVMVNAGAEPLGVAFGRAALGAVALTPLVFILRVPFPRGRQLAILVVLAALNFALPWTLIAFGQQYTSSAMGSISNSSMPLWVTLLAAWMLPNSELNSSTIAGILLGFAGVVVLTTPDLVSSDLSALRGVPVMVIATMFYALSSIVIRTRLTGVHPIGMTYVQIAGAATFLALPMAATRGYAGIDWSPGVIGSLVARGALGSGVAVAGYMWLIGVAGPVKASVTTYLMPFVGVTLGWLVLDESIGWSVFAGMVLVIAGVALVQGAGRKLMRRFRPPLGVAPADSGAR